MNEKTPIRDGVLRKIWSGEMTALQAVEYADDLWKRSVGTGTGNHEDQYEPGMKDYRIEWDRTISKEERPMYTPIEAQITALFEKLDKEHS